MPDDRFFHPAWPVFHDDNHLLVVYKPALIPVQGGMDRRVSMLDLARRWIGIRYRKPGRVYLGLVHRLDFPVAGVMAFARTSKAAGRLCARFREGAVGKTYLAVVEGIPATREGTLHHMLARGRTGSRIAAEGDHKVRDALLHYRVLDTFKDRALVEVDLKTGRKHQIRLQLSQSGHPVLGDSRYGSTTAVPGGCIALLSRRLIVSHPTTAINMSFECPVPEEWPWPESIDPEGSLSPPWTWPSIREHQDCLDTAIYR